MSGPTTKTPFPGIGSIGSATAAGASAIAATRATNAADRRSVAGIFFSPYACPPPLAAYAQCARATIDRFADSVGCLAALVAHNPARDEMFDQRDRAGGEMLRHRRARELVVALFQRGQDSSMLLH